MYAIVTKHAPRGSWQMASSVVFDNKEKADSRAAAMRRLATVNVKFAVVYIGDSDDWGA